MIGYAITIFVLLAAGAAFYYYNLKNKKTDEYIWVGPGEDPFKAEQAQQQKR